VIFFRLFGNFAESLAYSKCACLNALYYPLLSRFFTGEYSTRSDFFPLSASILPRLAYVGIISDTDKGKRSLRARKFASGKPTLLPFL
jgi:hypothetical protein